jgi:hypothetical protein
VLTKSKDTRSAGPDARGREAATIRRMTPSPAGSAARSVAYGVSAGAAGAAAHVAAATLLLWTGALLVVAP